MARSKDFDEQEVLRKAIGQFWQNGYHGTSMQDLVRALAISRSSLYDTYGDKYTLFIKALETYLASTGNSLLATLENQVSARMAIRQLLDFIKQQMLTDTAHKGCFMVNSEVELAAHDARVCTLVKKQEQIIEGALAELLLNGQEMGDINKSLDHKTLARFIGVTINGLRVSSRIERDEAFYDGVIDSLMQVLAPIAH